MCMGSVSAGQMSFPTVILWGQTATWFARWQHLVWQFMWPYIWNRWVRCTGCNWLREYNRSTDRSLETDKICGMGNLCRRFWEFQVPSTPSCADQNCVLIFRLYGCFVMISKTKAVQPLFGVWKYCRPKNDGTCLSLETEMESWHWDPTNTADRNSQFRQAFPAFQ